MNIIKSQNTMAAIMMSCILGTMIIKFVPHKLPIMVLVIALCVIAFVVTHCYFKLVWYGFCFFIPILLIIIELILGEFCVAYTVMVYSCVSIIFQILILLKFKPQNEKEKQCWFIILGGQIPSEILFLIGTVYILYRGIVLWPLTQPLF